MKKLKELFTFSGFNSFLNSLKIFEKILFFIFSFLFFFSSTILSLNFYLDRTKIIPKEGGTLRVGMVGFPSLLNPIYSLTSDVDDSIVELLFSGLMKYQDGKLVPEMVESFEILNDGRVYEFTLKENLFWSDGEKITSEDVIFTVKSIQNPEVKSPLRTIWLGVEAEKISERKFRFLLKNTSAVFLENCTLKIIPKHLWEKIPHLNFHLSYLNLEPVGSGKYKIERIERDKEGKIVFLSLVENEKYFGKKPFIKKINFLFFENEEKLLEAAKKKDIDLFSQNKVKEVIGFSKIRFKMPRYFAVFFNLEKKVFSKEVREALNLATEKREILKNAFSFDGEIINSPLLPEIFGLRKPEKKFEFNLERAREILKKEGFEDLDGDGILEKIIKKEPAFQFKSDLKLGWRGKEVEELQKCLAKFPEIYPEKEVTGYFGQKTKEAVIKFQEMHKDEILKPFGIEKGTGEVREKTREKLNEICFERKEEKILLKFNLVTTEQENLIEAAKILKEQWKRLGVEIEIKPMKIEDLKREIIPKKDFDSILFGQILGWALDFFPFWHSSQRGEIGLNLANYENKEVDKILENLRSTLDEKKRKEALEKFQEILISDTPAIFLVSPDHILFVSENLKGIKPEILFTVGQKFSNVENWYLNEKRVLK